LRQAAILDAAAHSVIDTIADIGPMLDEIDQRLGRGEKP
jgi:hypothetical protein